MIDELTNDELKDPTKIRLVIKDLKKTIVGLKNELKDIDFMITDDEKGLKIIVHDLIEDVNTIDKKLDSILDSQKDTRKTVKNTAIGSGVTFAITTIIGFVLKQLGIL